MRPSFTGWKDWRWPVTIDTSSSRWSSDKESTITLKDDLFLVGYLSYIWSVIIHSHVSNQQNSTIINCTREGTINWMKWRERFVSFEWNQNVRKERSFGREKREVFGWMESEELCKSSEHWEKSRRKIKIAAIVVRTQVLCKTAHLKGKWLVTRWRGREDGRQGKEGV